MKALKDLTKDELLSFIQNHPPGDVNVYDALASCVVCGEAAKYHYECQGCQDYNEEEETYPKLEHQYGSLGNLYIRVDGEWIGVTPEFQQRFEAWLIKTGTAPNLYKGND